VQRLRVYQPRYRRGCLGELVQIDGSHHDWFEGLTPKCCLLVFWSSGLLVFMDDGKYCFPASAPATGL
jgi:hypothetical protein